MSTSPTASPTSSRWIGSNTPEQSIDAALPPRLIELNLPMESPEQSNLSQKQIEWIALKELFGKISRTYAALYPSTIPESQTLANLKKLHSQFLNKVSDDQMTSTILSLSETVKEQLYWLVWLDAGMPNSFNYGKETLLNDPRILETITTPLIYSKGSHLLEQLIYLLQDTEAYNLGKDPALLETINKNLQTAFNELLKANLLTHKQLKKIFLKLPQEVKKIVPQPPYYGRGISFDLYQTFGAHPDEKGTRFQLMAPKTLEAFVVLTSESEERKIPMKQRPGTGIWECYIEGVKPDQTYVYEMKSKETTVRKTDPFSFGYKQCDKPFRHESVVRQLSGVLDSKWIDPQEKKERPCSIIEVHLPSFRKKTDGTPWSYRELADLNNPDSLINYCMKMGYTDVELMAFIGHPQEISWGYQPTDYFAPYHEQGDLEDFKHLLNAFRNAGIGVIGDWPVAHFAIDEFALRNFDGGNPWFEKDIRSEHPIWGTINFNFENEFTRNFLISNAFFWLSMGFTGLRLDALESVYFLDFCRKDNWLPNHKGGSLNLAAIQFTKDLMTLVRKHFPGSMMIAEEGSYFRSMTEKGFDFDAKWAMKSIYLTLNFLEKPYSERKYFFDWIINAVEKWENGDARVLVVSHDNVGYRTLTQYMPGDVWQKWANVRLLIGFQYCCPGQKLTFMSIGNPETAWGEKVKQNLESVEWDAENSFKYPLTAEYSRGFTKMLQDLNGLYRTRPELWELDNKPEGLKWISATDRNNMVISYHRKSKNGQLACVHNCNVDAIESYVVPFPDDGYAPEISELVEMKEIFNSDDLKYTGSGVTNSHVEILRDPSGRPFAFKIRLAPLATMIFEERFKSAIINYSKS